MTVTTSRKDKQPVALEIARPCTVYSLGAFGYARIEARSARVRVAPYAQYQAAVFVQYVAKGKRSPREFVETSKPSVIVLEGHGHPVPRDMMTDPKIDGISVTSQTRWASCAPEWAHEFYALIDPYLAERPAVVLADYRGFDATAGERAVELARQGGRGPFTQGDRVITPKGPGVVVYRRMEAPDFREVACYSVKLDGCDHVGAIFPAEGVTWEGVQLAEVANG